MQLTVETVPLAARLTPFALIGTGIEVHARLNHRAAA